MSTTMERAGLHNKENHKYLRSYVESVAHRFLQYTISIL